MKKFLLICIFILNFMLIYSSDFIPALDLNAGGKYSYLPGSSGTKPNNSFGFESGMAGSFMANTDFLPYIWFIPTFTLDYSNTAQPLNIDDERFLFSQWLDIYLSYGINWQLNDNWELKLRGFYRKDYSQQTKDEKFGSGLYDYIDSGFYIENVNKFQYYYIPIETTLGFKYIDRRFPNYKTLLSDLPSEVSEYKASPNTYTKEKDNLTYAFYIDNYLQWGQDSNWFTKLSFSYDYIPYFEQKVIDVDGSLSDAVRIDRCSTLSLSVPYYATDVSGMEFGYDFTYNLTNQNYLDTMGTSSDFSDDKYIENYYNYYEHLLKFSINYEFPYKLLTAYKPVATIGLSLDIIQYGTRLAKNKEGKYKSEKEQDNNYTLSLNIKQNIMEFWSYYITATYTKYNSNMQWEAYSIYNYSYLTVIVGTAMSF